MEVVIERACGLDVHKDNITACILTPKGKEIQTFSMKTVFLLQLMDWIKQHECTQATSSSRGFVFGWAIRTILIVFNG
jgi:transposase